MPPRCAACLTKVRTDHALRLVQEIVAEDFFLRLFRQSRECSGKGDVAEQDGLAADDKGVFFVRLRLGKLDKLLIEQNRCAMACQGCGAVFLFSKKAVTGLSQDSIV